MKKYFNSLKKDRLIFRLYVGTLILIAVTYGYILININKLPPLIPVFNQMPWGEDRLSSTFGIFIPPIITSLIFFVNIILSSISSNTSPLISRLIAITSFLTALLTFLFIVRTIHLII